MKNWLVVSNIALVVNILVVYDILLNSMPPHNVDNKLSRSNLKEIHICGLVAFASAVIALFGVLVLIEQYSAH